MPLIGGPRNAYGCATRAAGDPSRYVAVCDWPVRWRAGAPMASEARRALIALTSVRSTVSDMDEKDSRASSDELGTLNNIYALLHLYSTRASRVSPVVESGSSLHRDLERSRAIETASRAHLHLRVAYEFLIATGEHVKATKGIHPFGVEYALARTALLAGAKALYILVPDDSDSRIARCAAVMTKDAESSLREARDTLEVLGDLDPMTAAWTSWREQLSTGHASIADELSRLGLDRVTYRGEGDLVRQAGQYLDVVDPLKQPAEVPPSRSISNEATLVRYWNQTSGYAHANVWPLSRVAHGRKSDNVRWLTSPLQDVAGLLGQCYTVLDHGFQLLERRGTSHPRRASFGL